MSYLKDVTNLAIKKNIETPILNIGEAFYNAIYEYDPEQANRITDTSLDPYNDKKNMGAFMEMLRNKGNSLAKVQT